MSLFRIQDGASLYFLDIWPNVRLGIYCEFFYNYFDSDIGFDPELLLLAQMMPVVFVLRTLITRFTLKLPT